MRRLILASAIAVACGGPASADTSVGADAIGARISQAIAARLPVAGRYHVALPDPAYQLNLPNAAQGHYDIAALNFDPARQSFVATLGYVNQSGTAEYVRIVGSAYAVIDVPAPAHDMSIGETIAEDDLTTIEMPADRAGSALITSADGLVGQATRRALRARTPLFAYDVKKPIAVKKGDLVTVVYALPGIELTAQGQAQSDAAKGDTISILNTHSHRTIEARVTGPGIVSVSTPGATLAANQ